MNLKLNELISQLSSPDESERRYAAEDLAELKDLGCIPSLVQTLNDPSPAVREAAVEALICLGGEEVCFSLFPFLSSEDVRVRNYACEILERVGLPATRLLLQRGLVSGDSDVVKFSIDVLGRMKGVTEEKGEDIRNGLTSLLKDPRENLVIAALEALGNLKDTKALPYLAQSVQGSLWVQCAAIQAIQQIGGADAQKVLEGIDEKLLDPTALNFLKSILKELRVA